MKQILNDLNRGRIELVEVLAPSARPGHVVLLTTRSLSHLLSFSTSSFAPGEKVVSNGPHAEVVCVPKNLYVKVPDGVSDEEAAFTVVGAIGLQGVRLAQPTIGECFVVTGLGLIGLLTVQILRANGCRVMETDKAFQHGKKLRVSQHARAKF